MCKVSANNAIMIFDMKMMANVSAEIFPLPSPPILLVACAHKAHWFSFNTHRLYQC